MVDIDKVVAEAKNMTAYHSPLVLMKWLNKLLAALEQSQKESIEHQLELLARDTDILLLKKRVAELEGDNHCLRVNLQALVTETPSGWTLTLEQAKADAMQALEDCKALDRKDGE